jgi:hypothetical protein
MFAPAAAYTFLFTIPIGDCLAPIGDFSADVGGSDCGEPAELHDDNSSAAQRTKNAIAASRRRRLALVCASVDVMPQQGSATQVMPHDRTRNGSAKPASIAVFGFTFRDASATEALPSSYRVLEGNL